MKLGIMQPYFFPYIGYYQAISAVDRYVLYDHVAYIKRGWVNRNRLLPVNGMPAYFTVPVKAASSFRRIRDIELVDAVPWRRAMLKRIFLNYKRAPYFEQVYPVIERVIGADVRLLTELNARSILDIARYLDMATEIITDTSRYVDLEEKLADDSLEISARFPSVGLADHERKVVRAIEICRREGADTLINAAGGRDLYDRGEFAREGINLFFLQTDEYSYRQSTGVFYPHLSIIDVLMNCGKEGTRELLDRYSLT